MVAQGSKIYKHMCGTIPEMAHYVDAVTVADQTPWAELKVGSDLIRKT